MLNAVKPRATGQNNFEYENFPTRDARYMHDALKCDGVDIEQLVPIFFARIRPNMTYAATAWFSSITDGSKIKLEQHQITPHSPTPLVIHHSSPQDLSGITTINQHLVDICSEYT